MSMSVSSGFAVIPQPNFEGYPPLLSSSNFTSRQGNSPTSLINGNATPLSLAQRSLKSLNSASLFEDEDEDQRVISSPTAREAKSSSLAGWFRGGAEDANLSPRRFSLFHPFAAATTSQPQQRGSNNRAAVSSQVTPAPPPATNPPSAAAAPNLTYAPPLTLQSYPQQTQPNQNPLSLTYPQRPSEPMRSVTPPPTIIDKQVEEAEDDSEGWVSISTVNMSPFMILRIKALIELASVEPTQNGSEPPILLKVMSDDSVKLKSCLKANPCPNDEISRLERAHLSSDSDDCYVTLLNDLLEAARQKTAAPSIVQINEAYRNSYQIPLRRTASASVTRPKLSFSEGASLLCFDSTEKPRRVKDNHKRHFAKFLSYQRSASAAAGSSLSASAPSLLGVPASTSPAPYGGITPPNGMSTSPQMPSPSSNSTQTPPPSPALSQLSTGSSTPSVASTVGNAPKAGPPSSPPPPMPPLRANSQITPSAPRHVSPRLTEAFVSSIASNTSASAAVLASVLQGEAPDIRVYGQTVKAPPKPLTSLLQRQIPRRLSASANAIYGGGSRNP